MDLKCEVCGAPMQSQDDMKNHLATQVDEAHQALKKNMGMDKPIDQKKYVCQCGFSTNDGAEWVEHQHMHDQEEEEKMSEPEMPM